MPYLESELRFQAVFHGANDAIVLANYLAPSVAGSSSYRHEIFPSHWEDGALRKALSVYGQQ